jgi:DNA-directed RNA polymerase specialized sigma24 family protein
LAINSPISHWISELKRGDADAAQHLWDNYFRQLTVLARNHVGGGARGGVSDEDVAQSVFKSLCLGARDGKFARLVDRHNLWALLVTMTANKSRDLMRREQALKRGGGHVLSQAALAGGQESLVALEEIVGHEPTPEFAAQVAEQCECLLSRLNDVERQIAQLKLQGFNNLEIAQQVDCGLRTVERRLEAVRRAWTTTC